MERLQLICGGEAQNSVDDLSPEIWDMLGWFMKTPLVRISLPMSECKTQELLQF